MQHWILITWILNLTYQIKIVCYYLINMLKYHKYFFSLHLYFLVIYGNGYGRIKCFNKDNWKYKVWWYFSTNQLTHVCSYNQSYFSTFGLWRIHEELKSYGIILLNLMLVIRLSYQPFGKVQSCYGNTKQYKNHMMKVNDNHNSICEEMWNVFYNSF